MLIIYSGGIKVVPNGINMGCEVKDHADFKGIINNRHVEMNTALVRFAT
jgi:hypothetical protein